MSEINQDIGIYSIRCLADGKVYVGQTTRLSHRKCAHISRLKRGVHSNSHLQRAFIKHGSDSFEFRVLEIVEENMLDVREVAWIAHYNSASREFGYNIDLGGNAKRIVSQETRDRISSSNLGKKRTAEDRMRMSRSQTGRKHSAETRAKISLANKGRIQGEEWIRNHAKSITGRVVPEEVRARMSASHKKMCESPEVRERLASYIRGRYYSPETRAKMSGSMMGKNAGKKASQETRMKMSRSRIGKRPSAENIAKRIATRARNKQIRLFSIAKEQSSATA